MFTMTRQRAWLSAGAMLLAGLTGCQHTHHNKCSTCDAKSSCAASTPASKPKVEMKSPTDVANLPGKATAAPAASPLPINNIPPVSNERYLSPERPQIAPAILPTPPVVIAEKPKPELTPPVTPAATNDAPATTVIPPVGKDFAPRRSFADITAKPEFGHASDYSWLTGELSHIPSKNQWRLRFASIDDEDKYGGSVTLDASLELRGFLSGQLVRVEGEVIDKDSRDIAPKYRVKIIAPVKK